MPPSARPPTLDPIAVSHWQRCAPAESPWLHEEVAQRMMDRLTWIKLTPQNWVHWGAVRGGLQAHAALAARFPSSTCFVVEASEKQSLIAMKNIAKPWWSLQRLQAARARFERPAPGAADMLWANMGLHESAEPTQLLASWHAALKVNGFVMFSCLGPDTARELHEVYARMGWPVAGADMTDMHDWGDMLVSTGFAEPVMDMERITLTYDTPARLLKELRELGRNVHPARFQGLRGRGWKNKLEQALDQHLPRDASGRLSLTFEVIYGHAFKAAPKIKVSALSAVSVSDMRSMLGQPR
ncbi:MAG: biotin synthase [Polaromonas sp.]